MSLAHPELVEGLAASWLGVGLLGLIPAWRGYVRRRRWLSELDSSGDNGLMRLIAAGYLQQRRISLAIQVLQIGAGLALFAPMPEHIWLVLAALFVASVLTALSSYLADRYATARAEYVARTGESR